MKKDNETYIEQLNEQIAGLQKHLKEQRNSGEEQNQLARDEMTK